MMNILLLSLPIVIIAFIFESYPRFFNREYGIDVWTHLLYLKEYHRQKGIPKKIENGFLVPGDYDYPPAFIFLLSKLPFKLVERYEFLFSPFFDSIHLIIIFTISFLLTGNIIVAILTQVLYILTPIIILENSSATPRSMGYTLFTALMMSMIVFYREPNSVLIVLMLISGTLIFLTHRFTTQAFLFFSILFGIIDRSLFPPLIFATSFVLSILLSRGFYFKVLMGHLGNLNFWRKNIEYRFAHQVKGNIKPKETRDFIFRIYNQFLSFPPFVLEITNPWVLFVFYILIFEFPTDPIFLGLILWVVISYALALFTIWVPSLRFLGEGQRYLELSAFPAAFLSANLLISKINTGGGLMLTLMYVFIGLCALVTIIVIQQKAIVRERLRTVTPPLRKMFKYLRSLKVKPRLLCIPQQITTNTVYHTNCPVYVNANYSSINKISDVYPYIRKPVRQIMKENALDLILLNTEFALVKDLKLGRHNIAHREESFVLIKIV